VVTDRNGVSSKDSLDIVITDSLPQAADDANSVTEDAADNTATGTVLTNDNFGLDGQGSPAVTPITADTTYGSIVLNADGSYTYTLDNDNSEVNALNDGETLTDTVEYTITDGDGDTTTATLEITINGHTDGEPEIEIPVDPEVPETPENEGAPEGAGDKIVYEGDDATLGSFTVTAEAGVDTITVGGQEIQDATDANPVTITRPEGTLVITGYDATTGDVSYTYDPNVQEHTGSAPNVDSYEV
ncbi:VCBS domain-containing protein, partial [Streptococcus salivarius]|uniref:VCBS domain-containing protein n=1 Tax=Streptococcus salivarius TaxID=1304 RepID=UPI00019FC9E8